MSSRVNYYFRQGVTEGELDLGFELLEQADRDLASDIGIFGIIDGMRASERNGVPDLSVDLTAPGRAYDRLGRRIFYGTAQTFDLSTDVNSVSTAVQGDGNEKIVSLFIQFDRRLSDPRTDGNSQQVFFRRDESFRFIVRQGTEAPVGQAVPPPLQPDALLIVDVTRRFGQSQILNSDLRPNPLVPDDEGRRQRFVFAEASAIGVFTGGFEVLDPARDEVQAVLQEVDAALQAHFGGAEGRHAAQDIEAAALAGSPSALPAGTVRTQLEALLAHLNAHASAVSNAHPASAIVSQASSAWADGSPNPAGTVQGQMDKIVADLAGAGGAAKIGAPAAAGSPRALDPGTVQGQLAALLGHLNAHANATSNVHPASAIGYAAGPAWLGGRANPASTAQAQFDKIVGDLGVQVAADDGAGRIGAAATAGTPRSLQAGSVRSQLDALLGFVNAAGALDQANSWSAKQSFLGASDINAALAVDTAASTRRLGLELRGSDFRMRLYYAARHLELTLNARWNGSNWERDVGSLTAMRLVIARDEVRFQQVSSSLASPFVDSAWTGASAKQFVLSADAIGFGELVTSGRERDVSTGPLTGYSATEGEWGSTNSNIGGGASFASGRLPAAPSSVTFTVKDQLNTGNSPSVTQADRMGIGWYDSTSGTLPSTRHMFLTFSAT
jgi:hypothetical protein